MKVSVLVCRRERQSGDGSCDLATAAPCSSPDLSRICRIFSAASRQRWVGTLQEHVREQLVFGRRRLGPGPHCQKQGFLELKGTKAKVYAAIITEEIWLYKSEQVRTNMRR